MAESRLEMCVGAALAAVFVCHQGEYVQGFSYCVQLLSKAVDAGEVPVKAMAQVTTHSMGADDTHSMGADAAHHGGASTFLAGNDDCTAACR